MARGFGSIGGGSTDSIATGLTTNVSQRTYSIWFYGLSDGGGTLGRMWAKQTGATQTDQASVASGPDVIAFARNFSVAPGEWHITRPAYSMVWHHLMVVYDSSSASNNPTMYLDGVGSTPAPFATPSGSALTTTDPYVLGNRKNDNARNWDGGLAEFAIWDTLLTDEHARLLYRGFRPNELNATNLVLYVPLTGTAPESDVSGGTGAATIVGTANTVGPPGTLPVPRPLRTVRFRSQFKPRRFGTYPSEMWRVSSNQVFSQALTATVAVTASMQRTVGKQMSATVAVTGSMVRNVAKKLTATTVAVTASMQKTVLKTLTATSVVVTASLVAQKVKVVTMSATVVVTASMQKTVLKSMSATSAVTASMRKTVLKNMTATSVAVTASLVAQKVKVVTMSATVVVTASMQRNVGKVMSATVPVTGSMRRTVGKIMSATVPVTASIRKTVGKTLSAVVSAVASIFTAVSTTTQATVLPVISGQAQVGGTLTSTTGTWTNSPSSYTYQWQRTLGGAYVNIPGATSSTYVPTSADVNWIIRCEVTAHAAVGDGVADSNSMGPVGMTYNRVVFYR